MTSRQIKLSAPSSERRFRSQPEHRWVSWGILGIGLLIGLFVCHAAQAARLDEMALDRWEKLREVERYQLQIAEKTYRERNWKVAAAEYEKFVTLYERSEGASYAQLKWSLCQVELRHLNTAVKEGFQSVIDYWPDSDDAVAASYFIGSTFKNMGETSKAKKAFEQVLKKHPDHLVAVYSAVDLIDIAGLNNDKNTQVSLWKRLVFETERNRETSAICVKASQDLATHQFQQASFAEGLKALETTYPEEQLPEQVLNFVRNPISQFAADSKTKAKADRLAEQAIEFIREQVPTDRSDPEVKERAMNLWFMIAGIHSAAAHDDKVPEVFAQIETLFGPNDEILRRWGGWYKSRGNFDGARQVFGRFEDPAAGQSEIAQSYRDQQRYDDAVQAYTRALALDPDNFAKWKAEMAMCYRYAGKYPEAIAVYIDLKQEDVDNLDRWQWEEGICRRDAGQYKEAIGVFRQCDNFPENYKQMAWCQRQLKQFDEAILIYNQIIGGHPPSAPWAMLQIGYTREQADQKELAIRAFQQVCKRFPKDGHASQAHAHLQSQYQINVTLGGATDE